MVKHLRQGQQKCATQIYRLIRDIWSWHSALESWKWIRSKDKNQKKIRWQADQKMQKIGQEKFIYLKAGWGGWPSPSSRLCRATSKVSRDARPWKLKVGQKYLSITIFGSVLGTELLAISYTVIWDYQDSRAVLEFTGYIYSSVTYLSVLLPRPSCKLY